MRSTLSALVIAAGLIGFGAGAQAAPAAPVSGIATEAPAVQVRVTRRERMMMRHRMERRMMRHRMERRMVRRHMRHRMERRMMRRNMERRMMRREMRRRY